MSSNFTNPFALCFCMNAEISLSNLTCMMSYDVHGWEFPPHTHISCQEPQRCQLLTNAWRNIYYLEHSKVFLWKQKELGFVSNSFELAVPSMRYNWLDGKQTLDPSKERLQIKHVFQCCINFDQHHWMLHLMHLWLKHQEMSQWIDTKMVGTAMETLYIWKFVWDSHMLNRIRHLLINSVNRWFLYMTYKLP
jgi:hypothetical protein